MTDHPTKDDPELTEPGPHVEAEWDAELGRLGAGVDHAGHGEPEAAPPPEEVIRRVLEAAMADPGPVNGAMTYRRPLDEVTRDGVRLFEELRRIAGALDVLDAEAVGRAVLKRLDGLGPILDEVTRRAGDAEHELEHAPPLGGAELADAYAVLRGVRQERDQAIANGLELARRVAELEERAEDADSRVETLSRGRRYVVVSTNLDHATTGELLDDLTRRLRTVGTLYPAVRVAGLPGAADVADLVVLAREAITKQYPRGLELDGHAISEPPAR